MTIEDNLKRLDHHFNTGYTQYLKYASSMVTPDYAVDLVSDTYITIRRAVLNGNCRDGVRHNYIIRSIKLNYFDSKRSKSNPDNHYNIPLTNSYKDDDFLFDEINADNEDYIVVDFLEDYFKQRESFNTVKLNFSTILAFVNQTFNDLEISIFNMKYQSGYTNRQIVELISTKKNKMSETKLSMILKRMHEKIKNKFN